MVDILRDDSVIKTNILGTAEEETEEVINNLRPVPQSTPPQTPLQPVVEQPDPVLPVEEEPLREPLTVQNDDGRELTLDEWVELRNDLENNYKDDPIANPWDEYDRLYKDIDKQEADLQEYYNMVDEVSNQDSSTSASDGFFQSASDFYVGGWIGLGEAVDQTLDTLEDITNSSLGTDLDFWDLEFEEADSTAEEVGRAIGREIPAIAAGTAVTLATGGTGGVGLAMQMGRSAKTVNGLLKAANVGLKARKYLVPSILFETAYAGTAQFTHDPNDPLLQDLFRETPESEAIVNDYLQGDVTDPEAVRRLKMGLEHLGTGLAFGGIITIAGRGLMKMMAKEGSQVTKANLVGLGDSELTKKQRVEDYLVQKKGYSPAAARATVQEETFIDSAVERLTGLSPDRLHLTIKGDNEALKRITARNVLEAETNLDATGAYHQVYNWERKGILDEEVGKVAGTSAESFMEEATKRATAALKRVEKGDSNTSALMTNLGEKIKVGLYDMATLDGALQNILTGSGKNATQIWKAYEKSGGKTEFFNDLSQSPYVLASMSLQRSKAHTDEFIHNGKAFSPIIPGKDGKATRTGAMSLGNIQEHFGWDTQGLSDFLGYVRSEKMLVDANRGLDAPYTKDELKAMVDAGRANQDYSEALNEFGNLMKSSLDYSVAAGTKSAKEARDMIKAATNDQGQYVYIPRHVAEDQVVHVGKGKGKITTGYEGLKGTTKTLKDPYLDVVETITSRIYKAQANIIKKSRYEMIGRAKLIGSEEVKKVAHLIADEVNMKEVIAREGSSAEKPFTEALRGHLKEITELGHTAIIDVDKARGLLNKTLDELTFTDLLEVAGDNLQFKAGSKTYDVYFDNGVRKMVEVKDPALARMINSQNISNVVEGSLVKKIADHSAGYTRLYSNLITKTPWFAVKSLMRDGLFGEFASPIGILPQFRAIRGAAAYITNPKVIAEMKAAGVTGGTQITEIQKKQTSLNVMRAAGETAEAINKAERRNFLSKYVGQSWDWWTSIVNKAETVTRIGEYIVAKNRGATDDMAAFMSQESLVNFSKTGTNSTWRTFTDHQVFFRPTYLGMAKTGEAIVNNPVKSAMYLTTLAGVLGASEAVSSLYPEYATKSEDDKNLWTYMPNTDMGALMDYVKGGMVGDPPPLDSEIPWLTFPAVHELQAIGRVMQKSYKLATDAGYDKSGMDVLKSLANGFTPMLSEHIVTPTLLSPLFESLLNSSKFHDGPILREDQQVTFGKDRVINPSTGEFGKRLSEFSASMDSFFGGNGEAWFTPITADYLMGQYMVGFGSYMKNMLDEAGRDSALGETPQGLLGDNSKSANAWAYMVENVSNVFFDSPAAGRALETFAYEMNNLVKGVNMADKMERDRFFLTLGEHEVTNWAGERVKLTEVSQVTRSTVEMMGRIRKQKRVVASHKTWSAETKKDELILLEDYETTMLLKYQHYIQEMDPDKVIQKLRK